MNRATTQRRVTNAWIRAVLRGRRYDLCLNLGCGNDQDKEGAQYSDWLPCGLVIKVDKARFPGVDHLAGAENLPFPDERFNFIFANWVLYKCDVPKAVSEMRRVLKANGEAIISYQAGDDPALAAIRLEVGQGFKIGEWARLDVGYRLCEIILGVRR